MAADVAGLAEAAHAAGAALVVDQAWGPHFGFHEALPPSALAQGADAVLSSTHKIVGSLTQSAMLHLAPRGRVDAAAVARAVRLLRSTSRPRCCWPRWTPPAASSRCTASSCCTRRCWASRRARES